MATDSNPELACESEELNPKEPCPAPTHTKEAPVSGGAQQLFLLPI